MKDEYIFWNFTGTIFSVTMLVVCYKTLKKLRLCTIREKSLESAHVTACKFADFLASSFAKMEPPWISWNFSNLVNPTSLKDISCCFFPYELAIKSFAVIFFEVMYHSVRHLRGITFICLSLKEMMLNRKTFSDSTLVLSEHIFLRHRECASKKLTFKNLTRASLTNVPPVWDFEKVLLFCSL